jgi:hypothetical protein
MAERNKNRMEMIMRLLNLVKIGLNPPLIPPLLKGGCGGFVKGGEGEGDLKEKKAIKRRTKKFP